LKNLNKVASLTRSFFKSIFSSFPTDRDLTVNRGRFYTKRARMKIPILALSFENQMIFICLSFLIQ
jgi:hypothetical protein